MEGDKTVGISDTIYITEDGCRSFFTTPREMTVKPPQDAAMPIKLDEVKGRKKNQDNSPEKAEQKS